MIERLNDVVADFASDLADDDQDANHVTLFVAAFTETHEGADTLTPPR